MSRHERNACIEGCIRVLLEEANLSDPPSLFQAAFRLQTRARAGGVFLGFDQALYRLKRSDKKGVFVRSLT